MMNGTPVRRGRPHRSSRANRSGGLRRPRTPSSEEASPSTCYNYPSDESYHDSIFLSPSDMTQMKPFPSSFSADSCLHSSSDNVSYPLIYISSVGTICIVLSAHLLIETSIDHSIRVVSHGNYSAYISGRGTASSIVHPLGRICYQNGSISGKFVAQNDKKVVVGNAGVLFTMDHLREAYLVSSGKKGTSAVTLDQLQFPKMDSDFTLLQFYTESQSDSSYIPLCKDIVGQAIYDRRQDGDLFMQVNGMTIRHSTSGDMVIDARPRHISCSSDGNVHVRSSQIDACIQSSEAAYVKYGMKRVHVSCSGMVVSDGKSCTSMDHFGRIIACS